MCIYWLVDWNIFVLPYIWKNDPNWRTHSFQRGWNHQAPMWLRFNNGEPPMTGNGLYDNTYTNGDDWGMVYDCFSHILWKMMILVYQRIKVNQSSVLGMWPPTPILEGGHLLCKHLYHHWWTRQSYTTYYFGSFWNNGRNISKTWASKQPAKHWFPCLLVNSAFWLLRS